MDEVAILKKRLARAVYLVEHLFNMIDNETWRSTGGDDGQGHYEGEYHAEKIAAELIELKDIANA